MKNVKMKRITSGAATALLAATLLLCVYRNVRADEYENEIRMDYQRCFTELVQYADDLNLSLEKIRFVNDPTQMMNLAGEIYRQAMAASANLGLLPLRTQPLENLSEFLAQSGDYAKALSHKMMNGETIGEEEYENLAQLANYSEVIAKALDKDLEDLYNGKTDIRRVGEGADLSGIDKVMGEIEQQLHDYPTLIYDGPFSSHLTDRKSVFLEGKKEISAGEAVAEAKKRGLADEDAECSEEKGNVPAYYICTKDNLKSMAITKQGGYLLYYINARDVERSEISIADARIKGAKFLEKLGFEKMKENYYETIGNTTVINYAWEQEGYTVYPDLVKVKVALDTGEVVGCETRGYLMYHRQREIPEAKISEKEAVDGVNARVKINSVTRAIIPEDDGTEDFCWQIEGQLDDRRCLIYVNMQTGAEEKLFLLIESDTGVLAV